MTPQEVANQLGCVVSTVRDWISKGKLKATLKTSPFGSYYFIKPADFERFKAKLAAKKPSRGFPLGQKRK